jgi:hypothetical protein
MVMQAAQGQGQVQAEPALRFPDRPAEQPFGMDDPARARAVP